MNSKTARYSQLKPEAIRLRREGKTFSEIKAEIGDVPKGTLSGWLKGVELTEFQMNRIRAISSSAGLAGRQKGAWVNRQKRIDRLATIKDQARKEYSVLVRNPNFIAGLVLYLAEGSKKSEAFAFMNSDPKLIQFMLDWIKEVSQIQAVDIRFRLYIHELYASENCEQFWMKELKVSEEQFQKTVYKPTGRKHKKNTAYKGCLRIDLRGSELYWKTMFWRDCFYAGF